LQFFGVRLGRKRPVWGDRQSGKHIRQRERSRSAIGQLGTADK
jgi:hypothetical protein